MVPSLDSFRIPQQHTPPPDFPMSGHGLLKFLLTLPEMKRPDPAWPRRIVRDIAYLFIPFTFVIFLLLLSGALLITWGRLSKSVLVGFCVTAGILIGLFATCHIALYCTWAKSGDNDGNKRKTGSDSSETGSTALARSVKIGDPIACPNCMGTIRSAVPATGFGALRANTGIQARNEEGPENIEAVIRPQPQQNTHENQAPATTFEGLRTHLEVQGRIDEAPEEAEAVVQSQPEQNAQRLQTEITKKSGDSMSNPMLRQSLIPKALNIPQSKPRNESPPRFFPTPGSSSRHLEQNTGGPGILLPPEPAEVHRPHAPTRGNFTAVLNSSLRRNNRTSRDSNRLPALGTHRPAGEASPPRHTSPNRRALPPRQHPQLPILTNPAVSPIRHPTSPRRGLPLRQTQPDSMPWSPQTVGSSSFAARSQPGNPRSELFPIRQSASQLAHGGLLPGSYQPRPSTSNYHIAEQHAGNSNGPWSAFRPLAERPDEMHIFVFRGPDLSNLVALGVLNVNPKSQPPELTYAKENLTHNPTPLWYPSSPASTARCSLGISATTKFGETHTTVEHARRKNQDLSVQIPPGPTHAPSLPSADSGYWSVEASLPALSAASTKETDEQRIAGAGLGIYGVGGGDGERGRTLRRRETVSELGRLFRGSQEKE